MINDNPAWNVFLGKKYLVGFEIFNPNGQYTISGNPSRMQGTMGLIPGTIESGSKAFLEPTLGANWMLNEKSSFSATLFGNGGMNTNYNTKTFYDPSSPSTGINLAQIQIQQIFRSFCRTANFDIPSNLSVGLAWGFNKKWVSNLTQIKAGH